tara:strand:- start:2113 stop:3330 length:1218 start_codon:yes stop_codon:yes gene_type:complete
MIDEAQAIEHRGVVFQATIQKQYECEARRQNFLIKLESNPGSPSAAWRTRSWNTVFHLVASEEGDFITLYTEKRDPSKSLVGAFLGADFPRIESQRSLPLSDLLFWSLVYYRAKERFGPGTRRLRFPWLAEGVRPLPGHPNMKARPRVLEPIWADGRRSWVMAAWDEERAHRWAILNAGQSENLRVIYCQPTFSQHHRCSYPGTHIQSLIAFVQQEGGDHSRFFPHARLLLNHLRMEEVRGKSKRDSSAVFREIIASTNEVAIRASDLQEARAGLEVEVITARDAAYFFSSANLLNAALTGKYSDSSLVKGLSKEVYSFKTRVGQIIEQLVSGPIEGVEVFADSDGLTYVKVETLQFSFHAIPRTEPILLHMASRANKKQYWEEIRLQPCSPLVLEWGRARFAGR